LFFTPHTDLHPRARGVVIHTGARTAIGRINRSMSEADAEASPLKQKLDEFGALLSKLIAGICIAVWVVNIPHFGDAMHGSWLQVRVGAVTLRQNPTQQTGSYLACKTH